MRRQRSTRQSFEWKLLSVPVIAVAVLTFGGLGPSVVQAAVPSAAVRANQVAAATAPAKVGELDCNGFSSIQRSARPGMMCATPRGANGGRFAEEGHFITHDQPSVRFLSTLTGSGRNIKLTETLPVDPRSAPTVANPGNDITHSFELSSAQWISTVVCDPDSAPLLPCTPSSDANAPHGTYPGAGSAFVELQFYPPGFAPIGDSISCDSSHWCSALTIDSLECAGDGSGSCNTKCVEPVNFAFVQTNGVPTGPPSPQLADSATFTPNGKTLLLNPGDSITVRMFDTTVKGGDALEVSETDHNTGQSGFMIASGANGFMHTNPFDCTGTRFNFQPEYNTAKETNVLPWGVGPYMINDAFEIGHFEACTAISSAATFTFGKIKDTYYKKCAGPYVTGQDAAKYEPNEAPCYRSHDIHHGLAAPDLVTGCDLFVNGIADLNHDGSAYWSDWPNSTTANNFPTPFLQQQPTTASGKKFASIQFVTDSTTGQLSSACSLTSGSGCTLPPQDAHFYPFFTLARVAGSCVWEFGDMSNGNSFNGDAQYGSVGTGTLGAFAGPVQANPTCVG